MGCRGRAKTMPSPEDPCVRFSRACLFALAAASFVPVASAFHVGPRKPFHAVTRPPRVSRGGEVPTGTAVASSSKDDAESSGVQEYRNTLTEVLSNFVQKTDQEKSVAVEDPLATINFGAPKFGKVDLQTLAEILDAELYEKEWFVSGNVNPIYFSDDFQFQDPDVKLSGIEDYARGVYKIFDQETSRAEIISTVVNNTVPNTITCSWRLSGKVNIGPGLTIKPYICYTDFTVDEKTGLITFQEDRFDIPGWDIFLSFLFPFLIGNLLSPPAPPAQPRVVTMPDVARRGGVEDSPLEKLFSLFGK